MADIRNFDSNDNDYNTPDPDLHGRRPANAAGSPEWLEMRKRLAAKVERRDLTKRIFVAVCTRLRVEIMTDEKLVNLSQDCYTAAVQLLSTIEDMEGV